MIKYLIIFSLVFFLVELSVNSFLLIDSVIFDSYYGRLSNTKIESFLKFRKEWLWITYPFKWLIEIVSISIIASILYLGLFLSRIKVDFLEVFQVSIIAKFILFIPVFIKIAWFSYHPISLEAIRLFEPLSLFSLFDPELLQEWLYYPFKVLNLFEVGYWLLLAYLLAKHLNQAFDEMLKLVLTYYVSFLFCWIIFVMFISLGKS
jgi:hypothetical protein